MTMKPDFAKGGGLVPVIAQDDASGEVLMLAYMNEEAWDATLRTGEAHYYSRSRKTLWHKGATSGNTQAVKHIRLDCDLDTVLLRGGRRTLPGVPGAADGHGHVSHLRSRELHVVQIR